MQPQVVGAVASPLRQRPSLSLPLFMMICALSGCSAVTSVKRMDDNLDAIRPPIQEFSAVRESLEEVAGRTAVLQDTAEQMAATLGGVHGEVGELSNQVGRLSPVVRDLERLEQKLDLVNQELEHLSYLRDGIEDMQRPLGILHDLDEGIESINSQLGHLNDQLSELRDRMVVMDARLEGLNSIDNHLMIVDESIRELHRLVPMAAAVVPLLALWMMSSIFSQWLTRRRLTKSKNAQNSDSSLGSWTGRP